MTFKQLHWSRRELLSLLGGFAGSWLINSCTRSPLVGQRTSASPSETRSSDIAQTAEPAADTASISELPDAIAAILQDGADPDAAFTALMPAVVEALQCDRCFLFIRDPHQQRTRITHGYSRESRWPRMVQADWSPESPTLNAKDPLTLSAYQSPEAHFIEDIDTAPPETLDREFERAVFGHRALVHAPLYYDAKFYGILEPCVFETTRQWTASDRRLIEELQQTLGTWIVRYLEAAV
ncbi:MAG: GAF domain-containing protein [Leptolyngbyaceae cyanobacterium]